MSADLKLQIIKQLKEQSIHEQVKTIDELLAACHEKRLYLSPQSIRDIGMLYNHGQDGFPHDLALAFKLITFAASSAEVTSDWSQQRMPASHNTPNPIVDYNDIVKEFGFITNQNKAHEMKLAQLMYNYCHNGKLVSLKELQSINHLVTQANVDSVNDLFYRCFVKDISTWMLNQDSSERVPFATAQSRALWLIKEGYLKIKDVFSKNAPFGIFTSTNTEDVQHKIQRINAVYQKATLERRSANFPQPQFAQYRKKEDLHRKTLAQVDQQFLPSSSLKVTVH